MLGYMMEELSSRQGSQRSFILFIGRIRKEMNQYPEILQMIFI